MNRHQTEAADVNDGRVSPTAPESKGVSTMLWRGLESVPGFNKELRQAEKELADGKGTPFGEVYRRR